MKKYIERDFNNMSIMLIPIAVAINMIGGTLALSLRLPIYLDTIGTILIAMLAGPWIGGLTGFLSIILKSLQDPVEMPFSLIAAAIGVITGILARRHMFANYKRAALSSLIVAMVAVIMSVLIRVIFFGGFATSGTSVLIAAMMGLGIPFWPAQFIGQVVSELPDKMVSVFIPFWILHNMSLRYVIKFPNGRELVEGLRPDLFKKDVS